MATKKDLEKEVSRLNEKYFKHDKEHLVINGAYGGWMVGITGKYNKKRKKYPKWTSSGLDCVGNGYHDTAKKTIDGLRKAENDGSLKRKAKRHRVYVRERSKQKTWYPILKRYY
ncbi:MAG: hypothetical protein MJ222_01935 [Bacilli bacterium]|nr:hypothetical protein [Bacilli bacterium]